MEKAGIYCIKWDTMEELICGKIEQDVRNVMLVLTDTLSKM